MTRFLALDLSRTCAYAVEGPGVPRCGTQKFSVDLRSGSLYGAYSNWLADLVTEYAPEAIGFETPFLRGRAATRMLDGMIAVTELVAYRRELYVYEAPTKTVKKHFTGNGNASKDDMIAECGRRGWVPADEHQADALAFLDYAKTALGKVAA